MIITAYREESHIKNKKQKKIIQVRKNFSHFNPIIFILETLMRLAWGSETCLQSILWILVHDTHMFWLEKGKILWDIILLVFLETYFNMTFLIIEFTH